MPISKRIIDDKKVTDHHAIIPTEKSSVGGIKSRGKNLYDLVVKRFLAVFLDPCIKQHSEIITSLDKDTFKTVL